MIAKGVKNIRNKIETNEAINLQDGWNYPPPCPYTHNKNKIKKESLLIFSLWLESVKPNWRGTQRDIVLSFLPYKVNVDFKKRKVGKHKNKFNI